MFEPEFRDRPISRVVPRGQPLARRDFTTVRPAASIDGMVARTAPAPSPAVVPPIVSTPVQSAGPPVGGAQRPAGSNLSGTLSGDAPSEISRPPIPAPRPITPAPAPAAATVAPEPQPAPAAARPAPNKQRRFSRSKVVWVLSAVLLLGGLGVWAFSGGVFRPTVTTGAVTQDALDPGHGVGWYAAAVQFTGTDGRVHTLKISHRQVPPVSGLTPGTAVKVAYPAGNPAAARTWAPLESRQRAGLGAVLAGLLLAGGLAVRARSRKRRGVSAAAVRVPATPQFSR